MIIQSEITSVAADKIVFLFSAGNSMYVQTDIWALIHNDVVSFSSVNL